MSYRRLQSNDKSLICENVYTNTRLYTTIIPKLCFHEEYKLINDKPTNSILGNDRKIAKFEYIYIIITRSTKNVTAKSKFIYQTNNTSTETNDLPKNFLKN
jgi:hypothetical protein